MGLVLGVCAPILAGHPRRADESGRVPGEAGQWMRALAGNPRSWSSAPNFAFDLAARKTTDSDLAGLDLGGVRGHHQRRRTCRAGDAGTLRRSVRALQIPRPHDASVLRLGGGDRLRGERHLERGRRRRPTSMSTSLARAAPSRAQRGRARRWCSYEVPQLARGADRRQRHAARVPAGRDRRDLGARRECRRRLLAQAAEEQLCFGATLVDPSPGTPDGRGCAPVTSASFTTASCSSSAASRIC